MKVGSAMMRRVMAHDNYVFCESCSRFLFAPIEEAAPVAAAPHSRR